ncbi:MAG: 30S ribosomal protein S5 [Mycoplasmataceae bacterium]|nr:30S ribosomal protein S5 [Mycoplasmataceae bacterium]
MFFSEKEILNKETTEVVKEETINEVKQEVIEEVKEETTEIAEKEITLIQEEKIIIKDDESSLISKTKSVTKNKPDTSEAISNDFLPGNFDPFARRINPRFANKREQEFEERVLQIKRVIKVTKGGRRFKFSALVVVGDKKGRVGYAVGKHIEVPEAIKKASRQAKKNIYHVKIVGISATFPHEVIGHKGAARVMLKPAVEGKGIIASDIIRAVVELAGYRNIYSKNLGTNNPLNVIIATIDGLTRMKTKEEIAKLKSNFLKKEVINNNNNNKLKSKPVINNKGE